MLKSTKLTQLKHERDLNSTLGMLKSDLLNTKRPLKHRFAIVQGESTSDELEGVEDVAFCFLDTLQSVMRDAPTSRRRSLLGLSARGPRPHSLGP